MTQDDYDRVASAIGFRMKVEETQDERDVVERVAYTVANVLRGADPDFDYDRFLRVCSVSRFEGLVNEADKKARGE